MAKNKSMKESMQRLLCINATMTEQFGKKRGRSLRLTGISSIANIILGSGKLLFGMISLSFFTCVSALYTFGMVVAKVVILMGLMNSSKKQYRYYSIAGFVLIVTSLMYSGYSLRLFFHPNSTIYDRNVAIGIAAFTFMEIGLGIRGVLVERHNQTLLLHALKMINLASALISLVLTQTAILSFREVHLELQSKANGLLGVLMGLCATLLGLFMLMKIHQVGMGTNYHLLYRKVKKVMKKEQISCKIKAVRCQFNEEGDTLLFVEYLRRISEKEVTLLQSKVKEQLQIKLMDLEKIEGETDDKNIGSGR